MKTYLTYGSAMAFGSALLTFGVYFIGWHDTPEKLDRAQWVQMVLALAIGIACTVLGIKARRAELPASQDFGYASALGAGVMITLFAALIGIFVNLLYGTVINPHFSEVMLQAQAAKLSEQGLPADKIEQVQKMTATMMKPPVLAVMGFLSAMFFGTLISLVAAAFLKRAAVDDLSDSPPPLR